MSTARLDVDRVRAAFPSLQSGTAHFDSPGGSQTPAVVAEAVARTMTAGLSNRGSVTPGERMADDVVVQARAAVADLLGADAATVVFGRSMTQLTVDMARTLSRAWGPGDEVVVTRLDHDSNIRSWVLSAERVGATVRWLDFDPATGVLDDLAPLLGDRTRLVAFTGASNVLGTRPDVPVLTAQVREAGALSYVDAVHLAPHVPVSFDELGADLLACSPYKFFGPHHGTLVGRPEVLDGLAPDKLLPSSNAVPERFELGTLPYELLAGTTAAIDFIADLVPGEGSRRDRITASMRAVEAYEHALLDSLLEGLAGIDGLVLHGAPTRRTPTLLFSVDGHPGPEVYAFLAERGVNAPSSSFYAIEASRRLGLGDTGAVRVGLAAYSTQDDVDRLVAGLDALVRG